MKIGSNVDAWCSRCKLELAHTIEIVTDGKIKRVHCNTCRAQHAYRAGPPGMRIVPGRAGASRGPKPSGRQATRQSEYELLLRGRSAATARPYSTSTRMQIGDLVSHPVFGLGAVTGERDNKIDVLFPGGPRVLVHRQS
jgi:hypothetical protein